MRYLMLMLSFLCILFVYLFATQGNLYAPFQNLQRFYPYNLLELTAAILFFLTAFILTIRLTKADEPTRELDCILVNAFLSCSILAIAYAGGTVGAEKTIVGFFFMWGVLQMLAGFLILYLTIIRLKLPFLRLFWGLLLHTACLVAVVLTIYHGTKT